MTGRELAEWRAFERIEPFGEARADLRMGILAATLCNVQPRKRGAAPFRPQDFMPFLERPKTAAPNLARDLRAWADRYTKQQQRQGV